MTLKQVTGGWVDLNMETGAMFWHTPCYIGGLWPLYWADDLAAYKASDKRRYFLGKHKLLAYLTKRKLTDPNFAITDIGGILK